MSCRGIRIFFTSRSLSSTPSFTGACPPASSLKPPAWMMVYFILFFLPRKVSESKQLPVRFPESGWTRWENQEGWKSLKKSLWPGLLSCTGTSCTMVHMSHKLGMPNIFRPYWFAHDRACLVLLLRMCQPELKRRIQKSKSAVGQILLLGKYLTCPAGS